MSQSTDQEINESVARGLGWVPPLGKAWKPKVGEGQPFESIYWSRNGKFATERLPDYCHEIKAAWEIVEHCNMVTYIQRPSVGGKEWHVDIGNCGWSEAGTAPMAICLAFLKLQEGK